MLKCGVGVMDFESSFSSSYSPGRKRCSTVKGRQRREVHRSVLMELRVCPFRITIDKFERSDLLLPHIGISPLYIEQILKPNIHSTNLPVAHAVSKYFHKIEIDIHTCPSSQLSVSTLGFKTYLSLSLFGIFTAFPTLFLFFALSFIEPVFFSTGNLCQ